MKKVFLTLAAALAFSTAANAANLPLQTGPNDPSLDLYYNNQTLQAINAGVTGNLATELATVASSGTALQALFTYVAPGGLLSAPGQILHVKAWGSNSADANAKTLTFAYGSATCALAVTGSGNAWTGEFYVIKTGTNAQTVLCSGVTGTTNITLLSAAATVTDTAAVTVTVNATAAVAGTMSLVAAYIEQLK